MAKVREHVWVGDRCLVCGALIYPELRSQKVSAGETDPGPVDGRQCLEREDYVGTLRPEPSRRQYACEQFSEIKARADEVAAERLHEVEGAGGECC
jgi:hypothetical protein